MILTVQKGDKKVCRKLTLIFSILGKITRHNVKISLNKRHKRAGGSGFNKMSRISLPFDENSHSTRGSHAINGIPDNHITLNDVLFGRGGRTNRHKGNIRFRKIVYSHKKEYSSLESKDAKTKMAEGIVNSVRNLTPPGRFLIQDKTTKNWRDVGNDQARKKTSQALRERPERGSDARNTSEAHKKDDEPNFTKSPRPENKSTKYTFERNENSLILHTVDAEHECPICGSSNFRIHSEYFDTRWDQLLETNSSTELENEEDFSTDACQKIRRVVTENVEDLGELSSEKKRSVMSFSKCVCLDKIETFASGSRMNSLLDKQNPLSHASTSCAGQEFLESLTSDQMF